MKHYIKILIIYIAVIFLSCSNDENEIEKKITNQEEVEKQDEEKQDEGCDIDFVINHEGTACCTVGSTEVSPGQIVTFQYYTNLTNPKITWMEFSKSVTLIKGQGEAVATIQIGADFEAGSFRVTGENEDSCDPLTDECGSCSHTIELKLK